MINRLLKIMRTFSKKDEGASSKGGSARTLRTVIPRSEHSISRSDINEFALKVLYRLKKNGYKGYLVGGGVRDILLGHHPKDFDLVTDALPEEIRGIFNNCRLIGRRFRLAHVFFGREIIEVATFRGKGSIDEDKATSEEGMILRDNVYGTLEEDVWRRDFTINALYYNIQDFSLVDFTGGLEDLNNRILRMIGEPEARFREDPVRILRAIRLAFKLNLKMADDLPPAITKMGHLLQNVPAARLYEEIVKMFHSGHALDIYRGLKQHQLLGALFPLTNRAHQYPKAMTTFIEKVLINTDHRVREHMSVNPAFFFAAFLWYPMKHEAKEIQEESNVGLFQSMIEASDSVLEVQRKAISLPKRISLMIKEVWLFQIRLERRHAKHVDMLMRSPTFRAAYDFLLLRRDAGENVHEVAEWWTTIVEGDSHSKEKLMEQQNQKNKKTKTKSKRRPRKEKPIPPDDWAES